MATSALELRHLETLLALAECGSLSKAAARLFLTQSALSHQLKALESHYGAALIEKNVRPLRFTAIGHRLVSLARAVLPQVAEAGRDVARLAQGHAGPLRIAVQCHNCFDWLMPAMDAYRSLWPEVELDIISGFVVDPLPLLERGEAELAIIHDRQEPRPHVVFSPAVPLRKRGIDEPAARSCGKAMAGGGRFRRRNIDYLPGSRRNARCHEALPDARGYQSQATHRGADRRYPAAGRQRPRHRRPAILDRGQLYSSEATWSVVPSARWGCAANCMRRPAARPPMRPMSGNSLH